MAGAPPPTATAGEAVNTAITALKRAHDLVLEGGEAPDPERIAEALDAATELTSITMK